MNKLKEDKIVGIGSSYGGKIDILYVEGIGKLKGDMVATSVYTEGMFKSIGKIKSDSIHSEGMVRLLQDVEIGDMFFEGMVKIRNGNVSGDKLVCEGFISCDGEINVDNINIHGLCSIYRMYGDTIKIQHRNGGGVTRTFNGLIDSFSHTYLGRGYTSDSCLVDYIECTTLTADNLCSKEVHANNVVLKGNCSIGKLYCTGNIDISPTCQIGEILTT